MKSFYLALVFLFTNYLSAQDLGAINGHILDQEMNNAPMMMANVSLKGGSEVLSNLHGNFEIKDLAPGNYVLTISFSGYDSQDIPVIVKSNEVTEFTAILAAKTLNVDLISLLSEKNDIPEMTDSGKERDDK